MSVIVELSIFPVDTSGASLSPYVARVLRVLQASGLPFELNPMGTCIEGDWEPVWAAVSACMRELQKDSERVYLTVKADWRRGADRRMAAKVDAVREKLGGGA
jgi:uncharacterized protein (TIGR00106 family)